MEYDVNECKMTGTVERFDRIPTKTGTPMCKALLRCYKESVAVVAFREVAEQVALNPGDRAEVRGRIQSTSWTGQDGVKRYGWQIVAESITLIGSAPPVPPSPSLPMEPHPRGLWQAGPNDPF